MDNKDFAVDSAKLGSVWSLFALHSWSDVASMLAAFLSFLFICEWVWKKVVRPMLVRRGKLKAPHRRSTDFDDTGDE